MKKNYTSPEWERIDFALAQSVCELSLPIIGVDPDEDNETDEF